MPKHRDGSAVRSSGTTSGAARASGTSRSNAATAQGTARYRARFAPDLVEDFYRPLFAGRLASSIGVGTYLGDCADDDDSKYVDAIGVALGQGINLLDTAINYRCQRSERNVGTALRTAIVSGAVRRDEIVLCTKGGYLPLRDSPPPSREAYQEYVKREFFDTGVLAPQDVVGGGHAMTPGFIAHQLAQSRSNLDVRTIDLYYLHNPEQQLEVVQPARFRTLLRHAFAQLEEHVSAGDIGAYGCATWKGFRVPPTEKGHLSLYELISIARDVGGDDHHFRAIQAPINLGMTEAVRVATQQLGGKRTVTLLEAARELGVSVVASATLMQSRLAEGLPAAVREVFPSLATDAQRAIAFTRTLPGVTSALVGMKTAGHVSENLGSALTGRA